MTSSQRSYQRPFGWQQRSIAIQLDRNMRSRRWERKPRLLLCWSRRLKTWQGHHFAREAVGFLRMRGGDLVEAAIPSPAALQKLAFIYAAREAAWPHSLACPSPSGGCDCSHRGIMTQGSTEAVAALLLAAGQHLLTQELTAVSGCQARFDLLTQLLPGR